MHLSTLTDHRYRNNDGVTLSVLSGTHALVDAVCAALVFSLIHLYPLGPGEYLRLVIGYNLLAFALQPFCGILVDRFFSPRAGALSGIVLSIGALAALQHQPYITIVLSGLGNALFHVGGGAAIMKMRPDKAGPSGIFVAPGALGLATGAAIGRAGIAPVNLFFLLLTTAGLMTALCRFPVNRSTGATPFKNGTANRETVIALLLLSVALRSLLGFSAGGLWKGHQPVILAFAFAAFCGKSAGGLLADRCGWTKTGTAALALAALLFSRASQAAWYAVLGIMLLQMTMPVTLTALYRTLPERPGLAFGLCCLALVIGAAPVFSPWMSIFRNGSFIIPCALFSVTTFFAGLQMVTGRRNAQAGESASEGTGIKLVT